MSISIERQFLSSTQNTKDLFYEYESSAVQPEASEERTASHTSLNAAQATAPPVLSPQATAVAAASIADVPTSAHEIVRALVAHKLKKEIEQVLLSKSIKELSGGV